METSRKLLLTYVLLLLSLSTQVNAEYKVEYEQKLILINGAESRFMDGEHKPTFNFKKDEVLPYLQRRGWKIKSVHINEKSTENYLYGYVLVERKVQKKYTKK